MDRQTLKTMGRKTKKNKVENPVRDFLSHLRNEKGFLPIPKKDLIVWFVEKDESHFKDDYDDIAGTELEGVFNMDTQTDIEWVVFRLSSLEVEIIVLRHLGYSTKEILQILGIDNLRWFQRIAGNIKHAIPVLVNR